MKPVVLFVDDNENILQGLRRNLRSARNEWDLLFAAGGAEALKTMDGTRVDVVVSDIRMPGMDGVALLTEASKKHGHAVRIVLSGQCEDKDVAQLLEVSHQYMAKPMDTDALVAAIKPILSARDTLQDQELKSFLTGVSSLPSLPLLYAEISAALRADHPSTQTVEQLLLRDISLVAKIFQILNSSYFGSGGDINTVSYVWESLGVERLKALFTEGRIAAPPDKSLENDPFITGLWRFSLMTARIARLIAKAENLPQKSCDKAWVAGLLHAIGAVALYEYRRKKSGTPECADLLDAAKPADSYVDAGMFLSTLWGLPQDIRHIIRWHAEPLRADDSCGACDKSILAIVHAARAYAMAKTYPPATEKEYLRGDFLETAGYAAREADWRAIADRI